MQPNPSYGQAGAPPLPPGASPDEAYARQFVWSRRKGASVDAAHAAAAAAVGGRSTDHRKELCYWFQWAADEGVDDSIRFDVAQAAAKSIALGMTRMQALDVALAYASGDRGVRVGRRQTDSSRILGSCTSSSRPWSWAWR